MRLLFIILILLGFSTTTVEGISAQTKKKKSVHKNQCTEWKEVRNGATLSVKWKMKVWIAHRSMCQLYSTESIDTRYETEYPVKLYGADIAIHDDDILIITGRASGVESDGAVILNVTNVINKGVE
ncbi:MAG TPA: hypothetical protein VNX68_09435 [Nitrosopumilaceae archaeon]|jgi:hypothetical protein|nr:hypothetical protein [Nitrosopumilaceae archaeon]